MVTFSLTATAKHIKAPTNSVIIYFLLSLLNNTFDLLEVGVRISKFPKSNLHLRG